MSFYRITRAGTPSALNLRMKSRAGSDTPLRSLPLCSFFSQTELARLFRARLLACSMNMATIATALFPTRAASAPYSRSIVDDVELSADRSVTKKVSAVFQRSKVESDWAMMKYHKSELKTLEPARTQSVTLPTFNPTPTMSGPTSPRSIMQSGFDGSTPGPTPRADTSVPCACAPTMVGSILDDPDYVELVFEALIGPEALQKPSNFKDQYHGRLQAQQLMVRKRRAKQP